MLGVSTLWGLVEARAAVTPDAMTAVDEHGRVLTFVQLRDRAEAVAAALHERGVGPGVTVTWQLPTWLESMVLTAAIARLGARQNPILHIYRQREVGFCVRQTGARLLVVPTTFAGFDFAGMAASVAAETAGVEVVHCDRSLPEGHPAGLPPPPTDADEIRWYFYTSGTTADPKGAQHTDTTIGTVARGMCERLGVTEADRNALTFPFPHLGGIAWLFNSLLTGCANICIEAFDPAVLVELLAREGVTLAGSGTVLHQLYLSAQRSADHPLFPHVRGFPGGGAPKPPQLHHELVAAFGAGILSGYGLTEAPILTMTSPDDDDEDKASTEGRPLPGVELRLVTAEGRVAEPGVEGEIRAKAPQVMKGYVDASLDAEAFDEEGWFRTGDLGVRNERGMLSVTGRIKDVIIRKGENISAKEVEDHLHAHPRVQDVAVIGLPDAERGELVCAVIQTVTGGEPLTLAEVVAHLEGRGLMRQKFPERLEVVEALPRNPAGKVLKQELRTTYG